MTQSNSESQFLVPILRKISNNTPKTHTLDCSTGSLEDPRRLEDQNRHVTYTSCPWDATPVFFKIPIPLPCPFGDGDEIIV